MAADRKKLITDAQKMVERGNLDRAVKLYLQLVEETPQDIRLWMKIGDLQTRRGEKQLATDAYLKVADTYTQQGFYLKAAAIYRHVLKVDPELVDIKLRLAELYRHLGLLFDAMQQYENIADTLNQAGRSREALSAMRQIVELDPQNLASRLKLAEQYAEEGLAQEAAEEFARAADYLRAQERFDDFIKVAERLLALDPNNFALAKELATLYLQRGEAQLALAKLQPLFRADARDETTLALLADAFEAVGQVQRAAQVLTELVTIQQEMGRGEEAELLLHRLHTLEATLANPKPGPTAAAPPQPSQRQKAPITRPMISGPHLEKPPALPVGASIAATPGPPMSPARTLVLGSGGSSAPQMARAAAPPMSISENAALGEDEQLPLLEPELEPEREALPELAPDLAEDESTAANAESNPEIQSRLAEADVYVGYGLHDKAIDHIKQIFVMAPNHFAAHERLKNIYLAIGQIADAANELVAIAEPLLRSDTQAADRWLREALELNPDNARARALLNRETPQARQDAHLSEPMSDEIAEVEFYLAQGLRAEARALLDSLLEQYPGEPRLLALLSPTSQHATIPALGSDSDLAAFLEEPILNTPPQKETARNSNTSMNDLETHYELGVQSRQEGRWDDAIREFELAKQNPERAVLCQTMIGLCWLSKGLIAEALDQFQQTLLLERITEREKLAVYYEMAQAYEQIPDTREAHYYYEKVARQQSTYRDVQQKLAALPLETRGDQPDTPNPPTESDELDDVFDRLLGAPTGARKGGKPDWTR